ncbi:MAG: LysR family transcriptional regulator [Alphaproteobacteria bacterium]|nr:LysR family transcriptional regulator [Alphaproteobacteria bacterium]
MPHVDPAHLRALLAAEAHRSVTDAAAALGLERPDLAQQLGALELALGERVILRRADEIDLTEAGLRLVPQARRALQELERCVEVVADTGAPAPFELVVGTRYELGMSWLVPTLDALSRLRPERHLHVSFGDTQELLLRLDRGEVDAFISSARLRRADLDTELLHPEHYAFVAAPELARRHPLRGAGDARRHVLVDINGELPLFRYLLEALNDEETWPFAHVERMGTIAAIRDRVLRGAGVAVLPLYFIRDDLDAGRLVPLMSWLALRQDAFRLIWRKGSPQEAELRALGRALAAVELR